jgi:aspartate/glutamate racemase
LPKDKQNKLDKFIKQGISSLDESQEAELICVIQEKNKTEKPDSALFGCTELNIKLNVTTRAPQINIYNNP